MYKINQSIKVYFRAVNGETGITDLQFIPTNSSGIDQTPVSLVEVVGNAGLYSGNFTPNLNGRWWIRVSSVLKPSNIYAESYMVGNSENPEDNINTKIGEVQATPTTNTLLGRLKDIWDKLNDLFNNGNGKVKIWNGTTNADINTNGRLSVTHPPFIKFSEEFIDNTIDDTNIWSWAKSGSATGTIANNVLNLTTTTLAGDYIYYQTLISRFININEQEAVVYRAWVNFNNASYVNNIREFGATSFSGSDGFFLRITGSKFSAVIKKGGVETVNNIVFTLDNNWHLFEIRIQCQNKVWFFIDSTLKYNQSIVDSVLINDPWLKVNIRNQNTGVIAAGLTLQISSIFVLDEGVAGVLSRLVAKDDINLSREVLSDRVGRIVTIFPSVQGAPNNQLYYPATSIAPYIVNLWRKVITYNIPAGYIFNLLNFSAYSATVNYPSRITRDVYFGQYNIGTQVYSIGNTYANIDPQYAPTLEAEVTTIIATTVTLTITYVNQTGSGGRTGTVIMTNADPVGTKRLVTLQASDFGIKSVTAVARSGTATGVVQLRGIFELGYIYNTTANLPIQVPYFPTGLYVLGGVGGTINLEITASSTTPAVRQVTALHSLFLKG